MYKLFQSYVYRLSLPDCSVSVIEEILTKIRDLNSDEFKELKNLLSELFCKSIIIATKQNFISSLESSLIVEAFNNIKALYTELEEDGSVYNSIMNLLFLIHSKSKTNSQVPEFKKVADKLDDMSYIFLLELDGKKIFPIGDLLSSIFEENLSFTRMDKKMLNAFLLSMKLFKQEELLNEKYQELIKSCNLKCLEYLGNNAYKPMGDSSIWKENLINNGSLVLINRSERKIYVRNNDKEYFNNDSNIKEELNSLKEPIGYYYEETFSENTEFTSVEEIFKSNNQNDIRALLEMLYDNENYNIFLSCSLLKIDGKLKCTNKFVNNDKTIILPYSKDTEKSEILANRDNITKILKKYTFIKFFSNINDCSDFVLVGTICDILYFFPKIKIQSIISYIQSIHENFQSEIIDYVLSNSNYEEGLKFVYHFLSKTRYIQNPNEILHQQIKDFLYMPYKLLTRFLCNQIGKIIKNECFEPQFIMPLVRIDYENEISSVIYDNQEKKWECLDKPNRIQNCYALLFNDTVYFSSELDEIANFYEKIKSENNTLYSPNILDQIEVNHVKEYMQLQEMALCDLGNNFYTPDFETIAFIRLFHHCACFNLFDNEKWKKFYTIIINHEKVKFDYLRVENLQLEKGILYVPKDKEENDATLKSILNNYLLNSSAERNRSIYFNMLSKKNEKYISRKQEIKEIVFLFDNITCGASTIRCMKSYLGIDVNSYRNIQNYFCDGQTVSIKDILEKNEIKFRIRAFYATDEGKNNVMEFIEQNCKEFFAVNGFKFDQKISKNVDEKFFDNVKEIYHEPFLESDYPFIREFNLPKANVFPEQAVKAEHIVSIFIRKDEVYNKK